MSSSLPLSIIDLKLGQPSPNCPVNAISQSSGAFLGPGLSHVVSSGEPGTLAFAFTDRMSSSASGQVFMNTLTETRNETK